MTVVRSTLKYNLEKNIQQWTKVMRFLFYLIAFVHAFDKDFFRSLERVRFFSRLRFNLLSMIVIGL